MRRILALLCLASAGCASSRAPSSTADAGVDAGFDATDDACFPFCGTTGRDAGETSDEGGDAAQSCAQLKSHVDSLEIPARACNPNVPSQCTGTVQGICCPITVTAGNDTAANNFQEAVDLYQQQCDAACLPIVCPAAPSDECQTAQTGQSLCE